MLPTSALGSAHLASECHTVLVCLLACHLLTHLRTDSASHHHCILVPHQSSPSEGILARSGHSLSEASAPLAPPPPPAPLWRRENQVLRASKHPGQCRVRRTGVRACVCVCPGFLSTLSSPPLASLCALHLSILIHPPDPLHRSYHRQHPFISAPIILAAVKLRAGLS